MNPFQVIQPCTFYPNSSYLPSIHRWSTNRCHGKSQRLTSSAICQSSDSTKPIGPKKRDFKSTSLNNMRNLTVLLQAYHIMTLSPSRKKKENRHCYFKLLSNIWYVMFLDFLSRNTQYLMSRLFLSQSMKRDLLLRRDCPYHEPLQAWQHQPHHTKVTLRRSTSWTLTNYR